MLYKKRHSKTINRNKYITLQFNQRILKSIEKSIYISLKSIIRSQYYFTFYFKLFSPVKIVVTHHFFVSK
jgi:hypothetical protein